MNDVVRGGAIELRNESLKGGFSLFKILSGDRGADLPQMVAKRGLNGTVATRRTVSCRMRFLALAVFGMVE